MSTWHTYGAPFAVAWGGHVPRCSNRWRTDTRGQLCETGGVSDRATADAYSSSPPEFAATFLVEQLQERLLSFGRALLFRSDNLLHRLTVIGYHGALHVMSYNARADVGGPGDVPRVTETLGNRVHSREHVLLCLL